MSAELETKQKEEEEEDKKEVQTPVTLKERLKQKWRLVQIAIKVLELLICVICIFLLLPKTMEELPVYQGGFINTALTSHILINSIIILCVLTAEKIPFRLSFLFSTAGSVMLLIAGILLLVNRSYVNNKIYTPHEHYKIMMSWSSGLAILNAVIFAVDSVLHCVWFITSKETLF